MESILIPAAVAIIVFIVFLLLIPERISSGETERRKRALLGEAGAIRSNSSLSIDTGEPISLLKELPPGVGIFSRFPGVQATVNLLLKAGLWQKRSQFLISAMLVFLVTVFLLQRFFDLKLGALGIALLVAIWLPRRYLKKRIAKRNEQFLNLFPDTVDMIVRSVRSGHPLNTAMRMISENMESPVREEFKQVVDEVAYGRTLPEALNRLSRRIDEADLNFFVVVLSVQQETGGSLAEVLTNLSSIIRRRRQLRLKIRALTSEGRATSYVLGGLPVVEMLALHFATPAYLDPLFQTTQGNIFLGIAAGLICLAMWIVKQMVNIDI